MSKCHVQGIDSRIWAHEQGERDLRGSEQVTDSVWDMSESRSTPCRHEGSTQLKEVSCNAQETIDLMMGSIMASVEKKAQGGRGGGGGWGGGIHGKNGIRR